MWLSNMSVWWRLSSSRSSLFFLITWGGRRGKWGGGVRGVWGRGGGLPPVLQPSLGLTSLRPASSVGFSAVGAQILTSWSRPLVARTGRWGWGSRQFTWGGGEGGRGVCMCVCVSPQTGHRDQPQHPQALRWPSSPSPPPRVRVSQSEGRWGALAGVSEVGFRGTPQ